MSDKIPENVVFLPGAKLPVGSPPGGPHDPTMETRVARLEDDVKEVKASVHRLEVLMTGFVSRVDAILPNLATKADVSALAGRVEGMDRRLSLAESAISTRLPTWWQMPAVMAGTVVFLIALVSALYGAAKWLHWLP